MLQRKAIIPSICLLLTLAQVVCPESFLYVWRCKSTCFFSFHDIEFLKMWSIYLLIPDALGQNLTAKITLACAQRCVPNSLWLLMYLSKSLCVTWKVVLCKGKNENPWKGFGKYFIHTQFRWVSKIMEQTNMITQIIISCFCSYLQLLLFCGLLHLDFSKWKACSSIWNCVFVSSVVQHFAECEQGALSFIQPLVLLSA